MKPLKDYQFINLKTFRKSGEAVTTTVWFAHQTDKKLVMLTLPHAGKLKRLRNNTRVEFAPCNASGKETYGEFTAGKAQILGQEGQEPNVANRLMTQKYGWQKRLFDFYYRLQGIKPIFIEILLD